MRTEVLSGETSSEEKGDTELDPIRKVKLSRASA